MFNWTKDRLWQLRNEIILTDSIIENYNNSFNVTAENCKAFFDHYCNFLKQLMAEDAIDNWEDLDVFYENVYDYDTIDNLWNFYILKSINTPDNKKYTFDFM